MLIQIPKRKKELVKEAQGVPLGHSRELMGVAELLP